MNRTILINKFQGLPEAAQSIILDFIDFMTLKYKKSSKGVKGKSKYASNHNPWQSLIDSLDKFTPDYLNDRNQPGIQTRESID